MTIKRSHTATLPAVLAGMIATLATMTLQAAQPSDSPQRVEQHRSDLSGAPDMEVVVSTAEYQPGDTITLHSHHGLEAVYVVQGTTVELPGKGSRELATGASLLNQRDIPHTGFTVRGPGSLKLFTVHIVDKGKPLYEYVR